MPPASESYPPRHVNLPKLSNSNTFFQPTIIPPHRHPANHFPTLQITAIKKPNPRPRLILLLIGCNLKLLSPGIMIVPKTRYLADFTPLVPRAAQRRRQWSRTACKRMAILLSLSRARLSLVARIYLHGVPVPLAHSPRVYNSHDARLVMRGIYPIAARSAISSSSAGGKRQRAIGCTDIRDYRRAHMVVCVWRF